MRLDLPAQARNLVVDHALGGEGVLAPHLVQELAPGEDASGAPGKQAEQLELERGGLDGFSGAPQLGPSEIEIRPLFEMADFADVLTPEVTELYDRLREKEAGR